jgi:signal transduction histidine kinase
MNEETGFVAAALRDLAGEGTGLGLAIVAQVVRVHGGDIHFDQGIATFTARIRLPQAVVP